MEGREPICFFCGKHNATDTVHLIRRSYSVILSDNPLNIYPGCREDHNLYDNDVKEWALRFPDKVEEVFSIMNQLDQDYAMFWITHLKSIINDNT